MRNLIRSFMSAGDSRGLSLVDSCRVRVPQHRLWPSGGLAARPSHHNPQLEEAEL